MDIMALLQIGKICWFEFKFGGVAQLVRALACHARGRGFESLRPRHSQQEAL